MGNNSVFIKKLYNSGVRKIAFDYTKFNPNLFEQFLINYELKFTIYINRLSSIRYIQDFDLLYDYINSIYPYIDYVDYFWINLPNNLDEKEYKKVIPILNKLEYITKNFNINHKLIIGCRDESDFFYLKRIIKFGNLGINFSWKKIKLIQDLSILYKNKLHLFSISQDIHKLNMINIGSAVNTSCLYNAIYSGVEKDFPKTKAQKSFIYSSLKLRKNDLLDTVNNNIDNRLLTEVQYTLRNSEI